MGGMKIPHKHTEITPWSSDKVPAYLPPTYLPNANLCFSGSSWCFGVLECVCLVRGTGNESRLGISDKIKKNERPRACAEPIQKAPTHLGFFDQFFLFYYCISQQMKFKNTKNT
jgi:hypothetical protein